MLCSDSSTSARQESGKARPVTALMRQREREEKRKKKIEKAMEKKRKEKQRKSKSTVIAAQVLARISKILIQKSIHNISAHPD